MFRVAINDRIFVWFTALLLLTAAQPATAQQPRITPPPKTTEYEYNENWTSHIDNQTSNSDEGCAITL